MARSKQVKGWSGFDSEARLSQELVVFIFRRDWWVREVSNKRQRVPGFNSALSCPEQQRSADNSSSPRWGEPDPAQAALDITRIKLLLFKKILSISQHSKLSPSSFSSHILRLSRVKMRLQQWQLMCQKQGKVGLSRAPCLALLWVPSLSVTAPSSSPWNSAIWQFWDLFNTPECSRRAPFSPRCSRNPQSPSHWIILCSAIPKFQEEGYKVQGMCQKQGVSRL